MYAHFVFLFAVSALVATASGSPTLTPYDEYPPATLFLLNETSGVTFHSSRASVATIPVEPAIADTRTVVLSELPSYLFGDAGTLALQLPYFEGDANSTCARVVDPSWGSQVPFTIAVWMLADISDSEGVDCASVPVDASRPVVQRTAVAYTDGSVSGPQRGLTIGTSHQVCGGPFNVTVTIGSTVTNMPIETLGAWLHVAVTVGLDGTAEVYVNGRSVRKLPASFLPPQWQDGTFLSLGCNGNVTAWRGHLLHFATWSRVLPARAIAALCKDDESLPWQNVGVSSIAFSGTWTTLIQNASSRALIEDLLEDGLAEVLNASWINVTAMTDLPAGLFIDFEYLTPLATEMTMQLQHDAVLVPSAPGYAALATLVESLDGAYRMTYPQSGSIELQSLGPYATIQSSDTCGRACIGGIVFGVSAGLGLIIGGMVVYKRRVDLEAKRNSRAFERVSFRKPVVDA